VIASKENQGRHALMNEQHKPSRFLRVICVKLNRNQLGFIHAQEKTNRMRPGGGAEEEM